MHIGFTTELFEIVQQIFFSSLLSVRACNGRDQFQGSEYRAREQVQVQWKGGTATGI